MPHVGPVEYKNEKENNEVTNEGINPIRSSMIGLGTGFMSILFAFIGFGLVGTIDKKYNLIEKLTQKIMRNNK
jgi:hypothetical protein